jgi:hypothetical protein
MTDDELTKLEHLADAASSDNWFTLTASKLEINSAFISRAQYAVPALIAEVRALRARVEELENNADIISKRHYQEGF